MFLKSTFSCLRIFLLSIACLKVAVSLETRSRSCLIKILDARGDLIKNNNVIEKY